VAVWLSHEPPPMFSLQRKPSMRTSYGPLLTTLPPPLAKVLITRRACTQLTEPFVLIADRPLAVVTVPQARYPPAASDVEARRPMRQAVSIRSITGLIIGEAYPSGEPCLQSAQGRGLHVEYTD
jgi:hypothetical protein